MSRSPAKALSIDPDTPANASKTDAALQQKLDAATPAMKQYFLLKHRYPDCLLFYRMGDFYELFFDDAETASRILDITLTKRGKQGDQDVPMCGVPVHSHELYLEKLIASGVKVAICEQMENPAEAKQKRGYKAIVERDVIRVVTPGTITEERLLDARRSNFLAAVGHKGPDCTLGWVDITTGEFHLQSIKIDALADEVARLQPRELLVPESLAELASLRELRQSGVLSPQPASGFDEQKGARLLKAAFDVSALDSLGDFDATDLSASAALLEYLHLTQRGMLPRLDRPKKLATQALMAIDPATRRNLELAETQSGQCKGSLLHCVDQTVTAAGGRLLAQRLFSPLTDAKHIIRRLDKVQAFVEQSALRDAIRAQLRHCPDLERALSRLHLKRGGPRDLQSVAVTLKAASALRKRIGEVEAVKSLGFEQGIADHTPLWQAIDQALCDELPIHARDGDFVRLGYHAELDECRRLRDEGKKIISALESEYRKRTDVASLKIRFNNLLGYYVEVAPTHAGKMPFEFIHRQTMTNAHRYSCPELVEMERQLNEALEKALQLELGCFDTLCQAVLKEADALILTARALAGLDVATALAELAVTRHWCRPAITGGTDFAVSQGRHPVVEHHLLQDAGSFIANDCQLEDDTRLWLLTGPNMAGKSTFLRQNALIAILAQSGSYVPAAKATIGVIDRLFSRVGAADDLARGRSTFMVEMVETATILNQATKQSLVILDEIGRGTATYDGLSLAWAVVEYLHNHIACRALFATHYHEITQLSQTLASLSSYQMQVKEWKGDVVFLHQVAPGAADRSYGIHVAALAGLPKPVLKRAEMILTRLQQRRDGQIGDSPLAELPLFTQTTQQPREVEFQPTGLQKRMQEVRPDELSPRDALELIYELKKLSDDADR